jgi:ribosomal protein S18 acetylase RimI-like enzyme
MHPASPYDVRPAESDADLRGILALQAANLPGAVGEEERRSEGFVTLRHDLGLLREMNEPWPHVIATPAGSGEVVAYALVMQRRFRERLPVLESMFQRLERLAWRGRPVGAWRWYVMGQVCVAKEHRGRGLVERMYAEHRTRMAPHFDLMLTVIDRTNTRSVRAHEKAGFEVIEEYTEDGGPEWSIVAMDLRAESA